MRGEQPSLSGVIQSDRDQPRMRGEQETGAGMGARSPGPTPHARGAGLICPGAQGVMGTNPACAGSREVAATLLRRSRDQPRMRGEQEAAIEDDPTGKGPTPHARGAEFVNWDAVTRGERFWQLPLNRAFFAIWRECGAISGYRARQIEGGENVASLEGCGRVGR